MRITLTCAGLALTPDRARVRVAGLVVTRQRPGTASGVIFVTLEDETGIANVIVWPKVYERHRRAVISGRLLRVTGQLQREGSVRHLVAWAIEDLSPLLDRLGMPDTRSPYADEGRRPTADHRPQAKRPRNHPRPDHPRPDHPRPDHPRDEARRLFPSRDFH
jgi:error-prone DNA polymerase